jgi:tight adherence protein C
MQLNRQLDVLPFIEMLQIISGAGLTLSNAIDRVYEYHPSPIALEFRVANSYRNTNIKTRREVYEEIIRRVGGEDIRILVEEILQAFEIGTPIHTVLEKMGNEIRKEKRKKIKLQAQTVKWKNFMISLVFQLPPYLFILIGPSFYELINSI